MLDVLRKPTTIPPIIPAMIPDKGGAPEAKAIPKQRGRATRKTTRPDAKLGLTSLNILVLFCFIILILMMDQYLM